MHKPILCLDFDGVCHQYSSGWKGADVIADGPVDGLFEFLENALEVFEVHIFSSRSRLENGISAMLYWFIEQEEYWSGGDTNITERLHFPEQKPPAHVSLDDRAVTFTGVWPSVEELENFKPWNRATIDTNNSDYVKASR
jgi:hypothetical protein